MKKLSILVFALISTAIFYSCGNKEKRYTKADKDGLPRIETKVVVVVDIHGGTKQIWISIPDGIDARTGKEKTKKVIATLSSKMKAKLESEHLSIQGGDTVTVIPRSKRESSDLFGQYEVIGVKFPYLELENVY